MINLPLVRQAYNFSCGAACLASCLYYWDVWDGREPELYPILETNHNGTSGAGIIRGATEFGLEVTYRNELGLEDLKEILASGATAILSIQAWGHPGYNINTDTLKEDWTYVWEDGHYVVMADIVFDDNRNSIDIIMMDPSIAGRYGKMSWAELDARWHDWSDDGESKEYHTAIILKGKNIIDSKPLKIG